MSVCVLSLNSCVCACFCFFFLCECFCVWIGKSVASANAHARLLVGLRTGVLAVALRLAAAQLMAAELVGVALLLLQHHVVDGDAVAEQPHQALVGQRQAGADAVAPIDGALRE